MSGLPSCSSNDDTSAPRPICVEGKPSTHTGIVTSSASGQNRSSASANAPNINNCCGGEVYSGCLKNRARCSRARSPYTPQTGCNRTDDEIDVGTSSRVVTLARESKRNVTPCVGRNGSNTLTFAAEFPPSQQKITSGILKFLRFWYKTNSFCCGVVSIGTPNAPLHRRGCLRPVQAAR